MPVTEYLAWAEEAFTMMDERREEMKEAGPST
jgi:hypothetical protein